MSLIEDNAKQAISILNEIGFKHEGSEKYLNAVERYCVERRAERREVEYQSKLSELFDMVESAKYLSYMPDNGYLSHAVENTDELKDLIRANNSLNLRLENVNFKYKKAVCGLRMGEYNRTGRLMTEVPAFEKREQTVNTSWSDQEYYSLCRKCVDIVTKKLITD
jgi:hypothetical protein